MKTKSRASFGPAKPHAKVSTGEVIRMLRELKEWSQAELAERSGINATNLSLLENDKVEIGKKRAEQLAKRLMSTPQSLCSRNMRQRKSVRLHKSPVAIRTL
jgi:transcriptional regulator with XRE-family HTH domain